MDHLTAFNSLWVLIEEKEGGEKKGRQSCVVLVLVE